MKNKNTIKKLAVFINLLLLAVIFTFSVVKEESCQQQTGFYLKLAPVDPRSIMQGDYMILNYEITDKALLNIRDNFINRGYINLKIDKNNIGQYVSVSQKPFNDENDKSKISVVFSFNGTDIDINVNSYMFQEGDSSLYSKAEYAQVILVKNKLRLKALTDKNFKPLH